MSLQFKDNKNNKPIAFNEEKKKYYKDKQGVDATRNEDDTSIWEEIKIKENGRDYVISSVGYNIYGVDNYYPRGKWEWDGSEPIFNFYKTDNKKVVGFVSEIGRAHV